MTKKCFENLRFLNVFEHVENVAVAARFRPPGFGGFRIIFDEIISSNNFRAIFRIIAPEKLSLEKFASLAREGKNQQRQALFAALRKVRKSAWHCWFLPSQEGQT